MTEYLKCQKLESLFCTVFNNIFNSKRWHSLCIDQLSQDKIPYTETLKEKMAYLVHGFRGVSP